MKNTNLWALRVNVLDENNDAKTLYFSDVPYIDADHNYYEDRIQKPALIQASPSDGGVLRVFSSPSIGEFELIRENDDIQNSTGNLNHLSDYAFDNGDFELIYVDEFGVENIYMTGKIESMHDNDSSLFLTVKSTAEVLTRPHTATKYAGSNSLPAGVEGVTADIKGNIKPKVFGKVTNATPVFVNTARSIYQFSDRPTCTVNAVYDKGSPYTLGATYTQANFSTFETTVPTTGTFNRCMGFVKLGTTPLGTVTGDCTDSTTNAGDVFEAILSELTPPIAFDNTSEFDTDSRYILNQIGEVGIYVNSETSTAQLLDLIAASCGAHWYFIGDVIHARLTQLATTSVFDLTESEIVSFERSGIGLGENNLPIESVVIDYAKVQTVQQETELSATVSSAKKAILSQQFRKVTVSDAAVKTRHPLAKQLKIESCLNTESDANAVATRLLNLTKVRCDTVKITAIVYSLPVFDVGSGVTIYYARNGYEGRLMTVVGFELNTKEKTIILEVIG
ncbi:MAG: hypothetical protein WBI40_09295 [Methylococcaceae bacterium]